MHEHKVNNLLDKHSKYRSECINMIPSESIMSPATRKVLSSDLGIRYTGAIYSGNEYYKKIEELCQELLKKIFRARYINLKPATGMIANLVSLYTIADKGETILSMKEEFGSHYSHLDYHSHYGYGTPHLLGIKTAELPANAKEYNIDIEAAIKQIKTMKPRAIIIGATSFLFPAPIKELKEICEKYNVKILYDAAQVIGLIAGGQFQDPLEEGADIVSTSTNKTLCAPAHGLIMTNNPEGFKEKIEECVNSMVTSIYHLHHMAGLTITLEEVDKWGEDFAKQTIKNAQTLGKALYENEINALFEHKGFTKSHIVLVDMKKESLEFVRQLEKSNIMVSNWTLPQNGHGLMTGIRLGATELTKLGFREKDMEYVAKLISQCLNENKNVRSEVIEFMKGKKKCHFCFEENKNAYEIF